MGNDFLAFIGLTSLFACIFFAIAAIWSTKLIYVQITVTSLLIFEMCVFIQKVIDSRNK